jgi:hypothetical protein
MIFLYILALLLGFIVVLALAAPKKYDVSRKVVISASLSDTYQYLLLIKNQDHWSPWKIKDPNMKQEQTGIDGIVGFVNRWEGNKDVGMGEQELVSFTENKSIESEIRFLKPWKSVSIGYFLVNEIESNKTEVVWGFRGENKVPMNMLMLFYNMDKAVGKDFDLGLSNLKAELER